MFRKLTLATLLSTVLVAAMPATAGADDYDYLLAPSSECANQTNTSLSSTDQERVMRCMHNYARARTGRSALRASSMLQSSSNSKTRDMLDPDCGFSHTACGRPMTYWFQRVGYLSCSSWRVGENIAWGTGRSGTVREDTVRAIMRGWLHSDPHRRILLSPSYRDVGLGLRHGTIEGHRNASVWTAHFGWRSC